MRHCGARDEEGNLCTKRAGTGTAHEGVGCCSEHEYADRTVMIRSAAVGRIDAHDIGGLEELLRQEDANVNISAGEHDTLLEYAIFRRNRAAANVLLDHGGVVYRYDLPKGGRKRVLDQVESGALARKIKYEKHTEKSLFDPELQQQKKKEFVIAGGTVLVVVTAAYFLQFWNIVGTVLLLFGIGWFVYAILQKHKGISDGEPIPYTVWTFCTGGFFILSTMPGAETEYVGFFRMMENISYLLFTGFLLLWILALIFKENAKQKAVPLMIMFVISLLFIMLF